MAGRPAGLSDSEDFSDEDSTFLAPYQPETSVGQLPFQGQESKDCGDPWRLAASTDVCDAIPSVSMDIDTFRNCISDGELETIKTFFQTEEGQAKKSEYLTSDTFGGVWASKPAFLAAENGHPEVLDFLLKEGASVRPDRGGNTLLMAICSANPISQELGEDKLVECAKLVLDGPGGDGSETVNAYQSQGMTALMMASRQGHSKLVDILLTHGAKLDAMDTQRWSAVCFAVDRGRGHVARQLFESGADPAIITLDGQTLPDLVPQNNRVLRTVVEAFAKDAALKTKTAPDLTQMDGYTKFTELQNVLLGIDASEYLATFENHGVNLEHFLSLSEDDLVKMGIEKVGVRKRIVHAICEIHKRDWDKSSVPKIVPKDRRNGIYFTCPEAVVMVANINKHLSFLNANLRYLKKNVESHPGILRLGQDVASVETLLTHVRKSKESLRGTAHQLRTLEATLDKFSGDPDYRPADRIPQTTSMFASYATLKKGLLVAYCAAVPYMAFRAYRFLAGSK